MPRPKKLHPIRLHHAMGIRLVVRAMQRHPAVAQVQADGCRALSKLTEHDEAEQIALANAGGAEVVIAAMRAHPSDDGVQREGVWALINLLQSTEGKEALVVAGGVDLLREAMQGRHRDSRAAWVDRGDVQGEANEGGAPMCHVLPRARSRALPKPPAVPRAAHR